MPSALAINKVQLITGAVNPCMSILRLLVKMLMTPVSVWAPLWHHKLFDCFFVIIIRFTTPEF
jgi:hypothetical protein